MNKQIAYKSSLFWRLQRLGEKQISVKPSLFDIFLTYNKPPQSLKESLSFEVTLYKFEY